VVSLAGRLPERPLDDRASASHTINARSTRRPRAARSRRATPPTATARIGLDNADESHRLSRLESCDSVRAMDSLATVLRRVPIFADLPRGSFARIIADLREEQHPPGTVICREGEPARDFYIVKSGEVEVLVNQGLDRPEVVAVNGPNQWFGERALFSDRARSATVVARTEIELWRLTKEKFDELIEENPFLILQFTQGIGDRLYETNQQLSKMQAAFNLQIGALLGAQPPARRALLTQTAVLRTLEPAVVEELVATSGVAPVLSDIERQGVFVRRQNGVVAYPEAVREFLLAQLETELGIEGVRALHRRAAQAYQRIGKWPQVIEHLLAGGDERAAAATIAEHSGEIIASGRLDSLRAWLARLGTTNGDQRLAAVHERLEQALRARRVSEEGVEVVRRPTPQRSRLGIWLAAALGVGAGVGLWVAPPLSGLDPRGMHMLALLAWAVVFWVFDVLPDYVVGLGLILGWILFSVVPADVALSGFTTGPFFLIIGVLGIAASLQSSGLLFRLALHVMRRFPLTHLGQSMGLALSGTMITSCVPDVTSGVAIAAPITLALSDSLGYSRRSNGSAGLAMAAVLGFGQMSPFFLTGAAENLLAVGLLPRAAQEQITWLGWAGAALPLAVVTFALGLGATLFLLPPDSRPQTSRGLIDTQLEALGPPSSSEIVNGLVLLAAMVGWLTGPYHGIDAAWIALMGLALLLAVDLLDRQTFRSGIYWDFLFYLGAVLSLTGAVQYLGIDKWVIARLAPLVEPLTNRPAVFLAVLTIAIFLARFILPSFPLVALLTVTIVPIASAAGIQPLPLLLVITTAISVWFLPYQSAYYLALYFGTKEKAFTHSQVRPLAWSYGLIYLVAIVLAVPYWWLLGLVR
jgi:anion transporter